MTPKQRFQENKNASKAHYDLVQTANWQAAADASLLHMLEQFQPTDDPNVAMSNANQVAGAVRFLKIFSAIADPIEQPKPNSVSPPNLDHRLK